MKKKNHNAWVTTSSMLAYLAVRVMEALVAVWMSHAFFHISTAYMFPLEGWNEWRNVLWGNVVFGLVSVCTVLMPYFVMELLPVKVKGKRWYRVLCGTLYYLPITLLVVAKCVDASYFPFTYRLMSSEIFAYLGIGGDMGNLTYYFVRDYWPVGVAIAICVGVLILLGSKTELKPRRMEPFKGERWVTMAIGLVAAIVLARGGVGRCISLKDAGRYVEPKYSALVVNSGYSILRTAFADHVEEVEYMSEEEAKGYFDPEFTSIMAAGDEEVWNSLMRQWGKGGCRFASADLEKNVEAAQPMRKNVVILMMESFSPEYMGCYNHGLMKSRTPFLDELAQHSIVYQGRSNGKKSIESLSAVTASIPTLMEMPFSMSEYADNEIVGLPQVLKKYGFASTFYHGGYNGSMAFDKFCERVGFDRYVGMNEYLAEGGDPKCYDNAWGIYDEPFMQYAVKKMGEEKEPFFEMLFSISSHHPYSIPDEHKGEFAEGEKPLLPCVEYSDMALRRFFEEAKKSEWYENTMFVIIADHPGTCINKVTNDYQGWYGIPMIFYTPGEEHHFVSDDIVQQIDLLPTIVDYLGLKERLVCFGNSIFQRKGENMGYQVAYGNGWYVMNYVGGGAVIEGRTEKGDHEKVQILKAIVQQYNDRLRNDNLTIKK